MADVVCTRLIHHVIACLSLSRRVSLLAFAGSCDFFWPVLHCVCLIFVWCWSMHSINEPCSSLESVIINVMAANGFVSSTIIPPWALHMFYHEQVASHFNHHFCKDGVFSCPYCNGQSVLGLATSVTLSPLCDSRKFPIVLEYWFDALKYVQGQLIFVATQHLEAVISGHQFLFGRSGNR